MSAASGLKNRYPVGRKMNKRKKPSDDLFNEIYVEEIFEVYEKLVNRLSSGHVYPEIIPKDYQRTYCGKHLDAFSETSGKTVSRIFGSAFKDKPHVEIDSKKCNFHTAFEIMCRYNLAESFTKQLYEHYRLIYNDRRIIAHGSRVLGIYDNLEREGQYVEITLLAKNMRLYQGSLEFLHLLYTMNKYKILLENASSDFKATFRERNLAAKDQYIKWLEDLLNWRKLERIERLNATLRNYYALMDRLGHVRRESSKIKIAVASYENDKDGIKRAEALTGFPVEFRDRNIIARHNYWKRETKALTQVMNQHVMFYVEKDRNLRLKSEIKQLCDSIRSRTSEIKKYSVRTQNAMRNRLNYLTSMQIEQSIEKAISHFNYSTNPSMHKIANVLMTMDDYVHKITEGQLVKTRKEIQEQDNKIDQLEMKIIRHVIDTTTERSVKNKKCDKANSTNHNYAMTNDANSTAHTVSHIPRDIESHKRESKKTNSCEQQTENKTVTDEIVQLRLENNAWKNRLAKLREILITWLKKHKPNEIDLTKYENDFKAMVDDSLKLKFIESSLDDQNKRARIEKAAYQMTQLLNNLKLEFTHVDENLSRIKHQMKPPANKYSKIQVNSIKRCDTCKSYRSTIVNCTKYITHMLYEKNLNRFYVLTTAMDQLSFLLYMMRTPTFRRGMSPRDKWSIKKIRSRIIRIRNQMRKILQVKTDTINLSLAKDDASDSENPTPAKRLKLADSRNSVFINELNDDENELDDLHSVPSSSTLLYST